MRRNLYRTSALLATSFFAGALTQKTLDGQKKEINTPNCANYLSMELLKQGWRPHKVEPSLKHLPAFYISHFKPALTGSTAYAFIQREDDFFVLLNKQKRRLPSGEWGFVADMPCGFYNVRQDDLEHTQRVIETIGKLGAKKASLTHEEIQALALKARNQAEAEASTNMPYPLIDETAIDTALRELYEETGYEPRNKKGTLLNLESVNSGAYFYYRFAFLDHLSPEMPLPTLTPAEEEGIAKSSWVNVRDIQFKHDELGNIISGSVCIDGEELLLKPSDKMAANLAYAIACVTSNRFGVSQDPGQSYEEPALDGIKLK